MIPKIIHYCWFGRGEFNELIERCFASWEKYCKEYEIIVWNEENFDVNSNPYIKEAYAKKKWAFVSDYVRLKVLYEYGGIYLDTDVELIKSFDELLDRVAFVGMEDSKRLSTAVIASEKGGEWVEYLMSHYDNCKFITQNGEMNLTTNVETITRMTKEKYSVEFNGEYEEIKDIVTVCPVEYFSPKVHATGEINLTENTIAIHHFNASWHSEIQKLVHEKKMKLIKKYGITKGCKKFEMWYIMTLPFFSVKRYGIIGLVKRNVKKIVKNMTK